MDDSKVKSFQTHCPQPEELVKVLQEGLKEHFETISVELVDCPDFSKHPYKLAIKGLHGKPTIADVGGGMYGNSIPNLLYDEIDIHNDHVFN